MQPYKQMDINPNLQKELRDSLAEALSRDSAKKPQLKGLCVNLVQMYDATTPGKRRYIGVYGQQKAGKSTLFNSIVGEEVLPVSDTPTTGSLIDLVRNPDAKAYVVSGYRNGEQSVPKSFSTAKATSDYLAMVAAQVDPFDRVTVEAPFPHSNKLMSAWCVLRDTPGAIANPEDALQERLKEDSRKTLASLDEVCIPVFCVNAETVGAADDLELYNNHLKNRLCLHVLTHQDGGAKDETIQDFYEKFHIVPDLISENPVICTGKTDMGKPYVDIGLEELTMRMEAFLDRESLANKMLSMAQFICQKYKNEDLPWYIDKTLIDRLKRIMDKIL